jgi:bacillithiol biosynthesis deacetylase BshB1
MKTHKVDLLAFAAHPDDIELSASGTLMKHIAQGKTVAIVDLTRGELGSRGTIETRKNEATEAAKIMGISARVNLGLADGFFEHNEESLLKIVEQIRYFKPEIVLANATEDRHPDHGKASKLVSDACFLSGLVKVKTFFETDKQEAHRPRLVLHYIQDRYIKPDLVVDITSFYKRKMEAVLAYKTQFYQEEQDGPKTPISGKDFLDFLTGRMTEFGRSIGVNYAEGFTVERTIGVEDLTSLL